MNNDTSRTQASPANERPNTTAESYDNQAHGTQSTVGNTVAISLSPHNQRLSRHRPSSLGVLGAVAERIENGNRLGTDQFNSLDELDGNPGSSTQLRTHRSQTSEAGNHRTNGEQQSASGGTASMADRQRERVSALNDGMQRIQEAMRTAQLARATVPPRPTASSPALPDETIDQILTRQRREQALSYLDRQEEFRERYREIAQLQSDYLDLSNASTSNTLSTSNPQALTTSATTDSAATVEQSAAARRDRDLERVLRDYRIARRALRTRNADVLSAAREQSNNPSYSGVLAQLAEQQSNNRDRMRARGQSRPTPLDRTDAVVDRIVNAANVGTNAWRSDDDLETIVGAMSISTSRLNGNAEPVSGQGPRSSLPAGVTATTGPYLGPTTVARGTDGMPGGMRDFHRRIEERERNTSISSMIRPLADSAVSRNSVVESTSRVDNSRQGSGGESEQRLHDTLERFNNTLSQLQSKTTRPSYNAAKKRARSMMKYLSELKKFNNDGDRSLMLVIELGIDSLAQSLAKETEVDLPLRIDELPQPPYSSWLESGMSWEGVQKGGFGKPETGLNQTFVSGPLFESGGSIEDRILHLRAWRHRERVRAEREERERAGSFSQFQEEARGLLRGYANNRTETLADVERHLSDLLEEEERRLSRGPDNDWRAGGPRSQARTNATPILTEKQEPGDKWPVKVSLHEVNWDKMTLSGTMVANQIPDRSRFMLPPSEAPASVGSEAEKDKDAGMLGMETFFDGDIIDFRTNELETSSDKAGYKVGGLVTDIKYWSRIGPFKQEVEKKIQMAKEKRAVEAYERLGLKGTLDEQKEEYTHTFKDEQGNAEEMDKEEIGTVVYNTMADCLSSRKWIEKTMGEGGWVFMRWKERCFITPPSTRPSSSSSSTPANVTEYSRLRTVVHRPTPTTQSYTTTYTNDQHNDRASWGLTIRGFYYVAMHRMTGRIEALYYDSGSQPYQELICRPVGMDSSVHKGDQEIGMDEVGVKRQFGSFQFR